MRVGLRIQPVDEKDFRDRFGFGALASHRIPLV